MKEQVYKEFAISLRCLDNQRGDIFHLRSQKKVMKALLAELNVFFKSKILYLGNFEEVSSTIYYCGKSKIRSLNSNFRNKDKVTDVLSFPLFDTFRVKEDFIPPSIELGDIFICRDIAIIQAREYELSLEQEVLRQIIHGILHLLGFDHELGPNEEELMFSIQEDIFKKVAKRIGWSIYAGR